jgi:hypothetical protein
MRWTRSVVVALSAVVALVATAAPAVAEDEGFRGRYYATWTHIDEGCGDSQGGVRIRYISETRRRYNPAGPDTGFVLTYSRNHHWHYGGDMESGFFLRYRPLTDSARVTAWEAECQWRVHLIRRDLP